MTQNERTHILACGIAEALGDGWTKAPSQNQHGEVTYSATVTHADGYGLTLSIAEPNRSDREPRVVVSGVYPKYTDTCGTVRTVDPSDLWNPQVNRPEITVSTEKTPEQIARDITRRFLPIYLPIRERCQKVADQNNDYTRQREETATALAAIPGMTMGRGNNAAWIKLPNRKWDINLRVTSAAGVELKVGDLTPAEVSHIIDLLTK